VLFLDVRQAGARLAAIARPSHLAMKASYVVRFDNLPSLNAAGMAPLRTSDRILSTGIQVTF